MLVPAPASHPQKGPSLPPRLQRGDRKPTVEAGSPAPTAPGPEPREEGGARVHIPQLQAREPRHGWGLGVRWPGPARPAPGRAGRAMAWRLPHHGHGWQRVSKAGRLSSALPHQLGLRRPCLLRMWRGSCPSLSPSWHGMGRRQPSPTPIPGPTRRPPSTPTPRPGVDSQPQDTGRHLLSRSCSQPSPGLWGEGRVLGPAWWGVGTEGGAGRRYLNGHAYLLPSRFCHCPRALPRPRVHLFFCFSGEIKLAERMLSMWVLGGGG